MTAPREQVHRGGKRALRRAVRAETDRAGARPPTFPVPGTTPDRRPDYVSPASASAAMHVRRQRRR
eukprot:4763132-Pyramimonas_sp.AAC.1